MTRKTWVPLIFQQSPKTERVEDVGGSRASSGRTEKRKDRHSEAIQHLGCDSMESTKRIHSGLSHRKFWGPEWVGVKPNTKPRKHRGANNTKPDLERTGQR